MPQTGPDEKLRLLAVVAHPHDITHMCGTLAHHVERGDSVTAVTVTGGRRVHREKLHDELRKPPQERNVEILLQSEEAYGEQKAHEMVQVCALFGVTDVRILPFPDNPFEASAEVIETLAEIVYQVRPHLVLTHAPMFRSRHGYENVMPDDHVQTGIAVQRAYQKAGTADAETKRMPHDVASVYYIGVDFHIEDADLSVDISDQAANRVRAEMLFTTQAHTPEFARKRIDIGAGFYGWRANVSYAETWVRAHAEVGQCLTITDHDLGTAEISRQELFARLATRVTAEQ